MKGQGIEFLIHVGLDTNQLNGDGFKIFVDPDQVVKQGDILLTFDSEILKKHRCIDATPFVFTNLNRKNITVNRYGMVNLNEPFIIVERG
ncbi:MAG TPA: PTS glucose transporter subunit IIA [Thomasclavelia ramosa]|nr:PTS glucose transporter subunit IIA [Thomasclavelia ramosa]